MKRALSLFDLTNITVGSIVGADIYIASAITAGLLGPLSLAAWAVAGLMAAVLALVLASCSRLIPRVGGPYAYATEAFNGFVGFLVGWSLWVAELIALPVFAIAFVNYLNYFVDLPLWGELLVKAAFLGVLTGVNVAGVKAAGRLNDLLTILKLSPLVGLVAFGIFEFIQDPAPLSRNLTPFAPLGIERFSDAVVLIFWAYVGFELTTIPTNEVKDPARNIPRAIVLGLSIVAVFYLATNFVVYGSVNWQVLADSRTPLVLAGGALMGGVGAAVMAAGALVSVSGSDESDMLATARLSYAMSLDGLFPRVFSRLGRRSGTPYMGLVIQGLLAFALSTYSQVPGLISFSVFNLSVAFLVTCLALLVLSTGRRGHSLARKLLATIGAAICLYLLYSTSTWDKIVGASVLAAGVGFYVLLSPKHEIAEARRIFLADSQVVARMLRKRERFLANLIRLGVRAASHGVRMWRSR